MEPRERRPALLRRAFQELLPPLMELLERRRIAGTLLYGKCAPHEVESQQRVVAGYTRDAHQGAQLAPFIGYEVCLRVARHALLWLCLGNDSSMVAPTAAQTHQILSCATTALNLMCAPRLPEDLSFNYEAPFLHRACELVKTDMTASVSREDHDALSAALRRLMDSGLLEERGMDDSLRNWRQKSQQTCVQAYAERAAPERQTCAHCGAREVHKAQFKRCSACMTVVFCCKDCQLANWPAHKKACKAARKAAEANAAE